MMIFGSHPRQAAHRYSLFLSRLAVALCLLLILSSCALPLRLAERTEEGIPVRFLYVDSKAREVCLAGSFNEWSAQSHCMARDGNTWSLAVSLPPGRYQYVFVIDKKSWQEDPKAVLSEETGFGGRSSILVVE